MKKLNNRLRVAELADVSARLVEIYKSETSLVSVKNAQFCLSFKIIDKKSFPKKRYSPLPYLD